MNPPEDLVVLAVTRATKSPCAKSKRGVLIWSPLSGAVLALGHNAPPQPLTCNGSDACRANCNKLCEHAEMEALRTLVLPATARGLELIHVKAVDGKLVASGGPSCWQCSRSIARDERIAWVWLYHVDGWRRYDPQEFHRLTLEANGIAAVECAS